MRLNFSFRSIRELFNAKPYLAHAGTAAIGASSATLVVFFRHIRPMRKAMSESYKDRVNLCNALNTLRDDLTALKLKTSMQLFFQKTGSEDAKTTEALNHLESLFKENQNLFTLTTLDNLRKNGVASHYIKKASEEQSPQAASSSDGSSSNDPKKSNLEKAFNEARVSEQKRKAAFKQQYLERLGAAATCAGRIEWLIPQMVSELRKETFSSNNQSTTQLASSIEAIEEHLAQLKPQIQAEIKGHTGQDVDLSETDLIDSLNEHLLEKDRDPRGGTYKVVAFFQHAEKHLAEAKALNDALKNCSTDVFHLSEETAEDPQPIQGSHGFYEAQGVRSSMEDAHFYKDCGDYILAGVFDGHGGEKVAQLAANNIEAIFKEQLEAKGNPKDALEEVFELVHEKVNHEKLEGGSTAVVSYIEKATGTVYTATLGDSEGNIYREVKGDMKSIPLSCVRDWESEKDRERVEKKIGYTIELGAGAGKLYFPQTAIRGTSVNVSRAIGDREIVDATTLFCLSYPGKYTYDNIKKWMKPGAFDVMSRKSKITKSKLFPGDTLALACDGLKDYVEENLIAQKVAEHQNDGSAAIAEVLVNTALNERGSRDNVTVLVIQINEAPAE